MFMVFKPAANDANINRVEVPKVVNFEAFFQIGQALLECFRVSRIDPDY